jgi:type IV pilus assembly protein PilW
MQAQYGYDASGDGRIAATEWVNADANNAPDLGGATVDWTRVLAVRYAILARSRNFEPLPFAAANPTWVGGNFAMTDLGGVADSNPDSPLNWRRYRYSVSESVIPLRNALWGRNQ